MVYSILGRVISKKNNIIASRRGGKIFVHKTARWKRFEADAVRQLKKQDRYRKKPITRPVHVNYRFYLKGKGLVDLDNVIASVNDVMEQSGIIENDRLIISISAHKMIEQPEYVAEFDIVLF